MLKWFSLGGVAKEAKRVKWPKISETTSSTIEVIIFTIFFGICFIGFDVVISFFLQAIGIG